MDSTGESARRAAIEKLITGDYSPYIESCARYVAARRPSGGLSIRDQVEDLVAEFTAEAVVAVCRYDHRKKAGFFTFLYRHLEHVKRRKVARSWSQMRHPSGRVVTRMTSVEQIPSRVVDRRLGDLLHDALPRLTPQSRATAISILRRDFPINVRTQSYKKSRHLTKLSKELAAIYAD